MRLVTTAAVLALLLTPLWVGAADDKDPAPKKAAADKEPAPKKAAADKEPAPKAAPKKATVASIHVTCPANSVLTLDGEKTTQTGEERWFVTPPLTPGKTYQSTIKIHFVRDGNNFTVERKVTLTAGKIAHVHFLPKEHFSQLHEDSPRPIVVIAPVRVEESEIPTDWPTDWTGN